MTAVHNPRSVVYTRRSQTSNSGAYYGTVCSSLVSYAWGLPIVRNGRLLVGLGTEIDQSSSNFDGQDPDDPLQTFGNETERVSIYSAQIGDLVQSPTHSQLVIGVKRDSFGRTTAIRLSESVQGGVVTNNYTTVQGFLNTHQNCEIWRYKHINDVGYDTSDFVKGYSDETLPEITYPDIMCEYGDKAAIEAGQDVLINVLETSGYSSIKVYKNGTVIDTKTTLADFTISNIEYGTYKVELVGTSKTSSSEFIAVDMQCSLNDQTKIATFASANAVPFAVSRFSSSGGFRAMRMLTKSEISAGSADCSALLEDSVMLKIFFKTDWGNVQWHSVDILAGDAASDENAD